MLPDLEYVVVDCSPNELGAVQAGLAFQVFQLLELLLRELDLRNLLCHSALFSDWKSANWNMDFIIGLPVRANAILDRAVDASGTAFALRERVEKLNSPGHRRCPTRNSNENRN